MEKKKNQQKLKKYIIDVFTHAYMAIQIYYPLLSILKKYIF
jgi:hypothetical protein